MVATSPHTDTLPTRHDDQCIILRDVSWSQYETLLEIRGDRPVPRITYLCGELELMSPSKDHERIKKTLARLLEAYAEERELDLNGFGSWTVRSEPAARGVEPDECYVLGSGPADAPHLAIEVIWTHGGLDKREVYRGLGITELWFWRDGRIEVFGLTEGSYVPEKQSRLLPNLDIELLARFVSHENQTQAVRQYRARLRETSTSPKED